MRRSPSYEVVHELIEPLGSKGRAQRPGKGREVRP